MASTVESFDIALNRSFICSLSPTTSPVPQHYWEVPLASPIQLGGRQWKASEDFRTWIQQCLWPQTKESTRPQKWKSASSGNTSTTSPPLPCACSQAGWTIASVHCTWGRNQALHIWPFLCFCSLLARETPVDINNILCRWRVDNSWVRTFRLGSGWVSGKSLNLSLAV